MISVIMGVNKFDEFVPLAVNSILAQTFKEFEFIIIANGSSRDEIEYRLLQLYPLESRLKIYKSKISQLAHALNIGIENAAYDYVARMDADDIAWPMRLEKQLVFMKERNLEMVGCDIRLIDSMGVVIGNRIYPKGANINRWLSFKCCFAHNTVLIRRCVLLNARGYNAGFNSEDYDLWLRLRRTGIKWDNMEDVLLDYRLHQGASQRRLLGYAESTALAMREFVLKRSAINFFAVIVHFVKSIFRVKRS